MTIVMGVWELYFSKHKLGDSFHLAHFSPTPTLHGRSVPTMRSIFFFFFLGHSIKAITA